jgi:hypothetical protein
MTATDAKPRFVRRSRPKDRVYKVDVPLNDDELVIATARAAAAGLSLEDYFVMSVLLDGEKGHA